MTSSRLWLNSVIGRFHFHKFYCNSFQEDRKSRCKNYMSPSQTNFKQENSRTPKWNIKYNVQNTRRATTIEFTAIRIYDLFIFITLNKCRSQNLICKTSYSLLKWFLWWKFFYSCIVINDGPKIQPFANNKVRIKHYDFAKQIMISELQIILPKIFQSTIIC